MNKRDLKKLSKSQLIELLLNQEKKTSAPINAKTMQTSITYKPVLTPKTSVKELVDYFERKRLPAPPSEWLQEIEQLNRPVPAPRTKKPVPVHAKN